MIHILPPEIANRIAAGEVVERPASVVRELIDNAVDAGATRIDVETEEGGLRAIRVVDNGCGMSPEDAALCAKRHATSKIHTAEDLAAITTKGFRGEALAAISSISRFELITRREEDEFGVVARIEGGVERIPEKTGAAVGAVVTVRDLFFNTPARKKFLKKTTTELGHILSTITWNALAHERIHFTFTHNGRRSLDLPSVSNRPERIKQLYSREILDNLIPVHWDTPVVAISGLISRPTLTRNDANQVFFFVNDRFIRDRLLHRAMMNGYRNLLPAGRYPIVFLYLEIDPAEIDINVHPTKQEVKFSREDSVFSAMYGAIRQVWDTREEAVAETSRIFASLQNASPAPASRPASTSKAIDGLETAKQLLSPIKSVVLPVVAAARPITVPERQEQIFIAKEPSESAPAKPAVVPPSPEPDSITALNRKPVAPPATPYVQPPSQTVRSTGTGLDDLRPMEKKPDELFDARSLEGAGTLAVRGQLLNSYILAEGRDGLYVIDQHAAHERLLFEQFLRRAESAPLAGQSLLFPLTVDFSPEEAALATEWLEILRPLGFDLETFGPRTFVIRSLPSTLKMEEAEGFLKDLFSELRGEGSAREKRDRALHTLACRAAVKFGDPLTQAEMEGILQGLSAIPRRNVCPHGRPNVLFVSDASLRRLFKRTGFS